MDESQPFDSEVDFDQPRRRRQAVPPPLRSRRPRRSSSSSEGGDGPGRSRSETLARIAWALPWLAIAVTIVVVGGELFAAAMIAFACVGLAELFQMTRDARPFLTVAFAATAGLVVAAYYGDHFQILLALLASVPVIFAAAILRPRPMNLSSERQSGIGYPNAIAS